tara:strand:- start:924 stop:1637 length:714 start_codon:yes stop_codon:yes gene_type:complete
MFFARQKTNKCGLHAIQNLFKSAKITETDMHDACKDIHQKTGDNITNHESFGGDWSVEAVLQAVVKHGYDIEPGVSSKNEREWSGPPLAELLEDENFRGMIIHQPTNRHFTCLRPEKGPDGTHLYYVDSQSDGPRRISPNLASRRCLAAAYSWEPFIVKGPEMDYVQLPALPVVTETKYAEYRESKRVKRPSEDFMQAWRSLSAESGSKPTERTGSSEQARDNPLGVSGVIPADDDT